ncbi:MAG: hypothetical protein QM589_17405 [Thermomicrobiales bacterium]
MANRMPVSLPRPSSGLQRRVQKELIQITTDTGLSQARVQASAEIEAARLTALATIGSRAQEELALLVNQERLLLESVPEAAQSLAYMREITVMAMGSVLIDAGRKLGRS